MATKSEYYDLYGFIGKQRTKIGYAFKTKRGTIRIKAEPSSDKAKLYKALIFGAEVTRRISQPTSAPSVTYSYDLWGWLDNRSERIGHVRHTDRGTLCVQVSPHIDKAKLYAMMVSGAEIRRSKDKPVNHSAADEYAA